MTVQDNASSEGLGSESSQWGLVGRPPAGRGLRDVMEPAHESLCPELTPETTDNTEATKGLVREEGEGGAIPGLDTTDFTPHTMESHRSVLSREWMQADRSKGRSTPGPRSLLTRLP